MIHICGCGKKFQRIGAFKRHRGICEILREKRNVQKKELEEISDIPPMDELWIIIKILVQENKKLKEEMKRVKANVGIQNKRIKILDWLNENKRSENNYENWVELFKPTEADLSKIFEMGFLNGMLDIIENNIHNEIIKAYNQKPNKIYIYNNECEWKLLELNEFKKLVTKIQNQLLKYFIKWASENQDILYSSNNDEYAIKSKELMGGSKGFSKTIKPLYNRLYKTLKVNFFQNKLE